MKQSHQQTREATVALGRARRTQTTATERRRNTRKRTRVQSKGTTSQAREQGQQQARRRTSKVRYELKLGELITTIPSVDVPVANQCREDTTGRHDEVQRNPDGQKMRSAQLRIRSKKQNCLRQSKSERLALHWSFIVQKNTEVIHEEVGGVTKMIKCYLRENQSEFSETRRLKDLVKENTQDRNQNGSRVIRCVTLNAPAKTIVRRRSLRQSESTNRIVYVLERMPILEQINLSDVSWLPHEHAQTCPEETVAVHEQGC